MLAAHSTPQTRSLQSWHSAPLTRKAEPPEPLPTGCSCSTQTRLFGAVPTTPVAAAWTDWIAKNPGENGTTVHVTPPWSNIGIAVSITRPPMVAVLPIVQGNTERSICSEHRTTE